MEARNLRWKRWDWWCDNIQERGCDHLHSLPITRSLLFTDLRWVQVVRLSRRKGCHIFDERSDEIPQVIVTIELGEGRQEASVHRIASEQFRITLRRQTSTNDMINCEKKNWTEIAHTCARYFLINHGFKQVHQRGPSIEDIQHDRYDRLDLCRGANFTNR